MAKLLDSAIQFLDESGWQFTHTEGNNWASVNYAGKSGSWMSWFQDRGSALVAYAVCPVKAPTHRWPAVSELISRANFGLGVGNFEMSFEDGGIRYKNGIYVGDEQLSGTIVRHLFYLTNSIMDDYLAAIMTTIYGDTLPELAIARVEEAIALRRAPVHPSQSTTVDALVNDGDAPEPQLINEELETLLATLSAGFGVAPESENLPTTDNRTLEALEDGTPVDVNGDAP